MIGKTLLHYRIVAKIGAGGQGQVYKATDTKLGRTVVIKVLPPELTVRTVHLKRFEREARLASSLDHPNICTIFDLGVSNDVHFIVMQHVEGRDIRKLLNGRPLEVKSALSLAIQVCDALAAAHARGIVHRDVKASNVMVTDTGQAKMLDFGLAKLVGGDAVKTGKLDQTQLTEVGVGYGTATYAAPEQQTGEAVDSRADIFSAGVLLYEMLTGKLPFRGKTAIDVRFALLHDTPEPLAVVRPEPFPPRLQEILDRTLAKNARDRHQTIGELRDELRAILNDLSVSEDPNFAPEHAPSAPRHLPRATRAGRAVGWIGDQTRRNGAASSVAAFVLLSLFTLPVLLWLGAHRKVPGVYAPEDVILRLHGSNTIGARLAPFLAEEFFRQRGAKDIVTSPGANAEEIAIVATLPGDSSPKAIEIRSHGSATAFTSLLASTCDIGLASRRIKADELQSLAALGDMTSPASEHILGLDGIAVIVNRENPIDTLTREQIARIFTGEISSWTQVLSPRGKIHIYARDDKSGTYDTFKTLVLGAAPLAGGAERFEDSVALSDAVARDPDGIGFIGLPYIRDAKALAVSEGDATPFVPNRLTVATEDYLLSRRLYLYTPPKAGSDWVRMFLDFALSSAGQEIVAKAGFIAQNVASETAVTARGAPEEYRRLTDGAERLSLNFRFAKGGRDLDNKASMDLDRVADFVAGSRLTGDNIVLIGFADDGANADQDLALSKERATIVAEQFRRRGVPPGVVTGFGDRLPVASSATDEGQEKNRRVEVWLRR